MKVKIITGIILASALTICSCDSNTSDIGNSLIGNSDNLEVSTATFNIDTRSILADSVLSRNTTVYLGKVRDPETNAYITANGMIQFHTLENYSFPDMADIASLENGKIIADSCEIRLYYTDYYGDSLATMKMTSYELDKPVAEGRNYYSNFDPEKDGYIRANGLAIDKVYTLSDQNKSSINDSGEDAENIRIALDDSYTAKDGVTYNNYGTYIMQKYYDDPSNFTNSYNFIHNVVPGFFFKNQSGLGSMAYVNMSQLNVYFRYKTMVKSSSGKVDSLAILSGTASFAGTEEVLQTTTITNDNATMTQLVNDNTETYLKTPAGIFTELTLPIDDITANHEQDTINSAKVTLTRINNNTSSDYTLSAPETLLMIPVDSMYSFFEHNSLPNYKTSFIAQRGSATSAANTYTFNNISGIVTMMTQSDRKSANWNKVVIIPVKLSANTATGVITKLVHDMSLTSTKLVGGSANPNPPVTIQMIYSRFK